jgi:hypothetical protein
MISRDRDNANIELHRLKHVNGHDQNLDPKRRF